MIPLMGFVGVKCAMLLALASPVFATLCEQVARPTAILIGIVVAYLVIGDGVSPVVAMGVTVAASASTLLLCLLFLRLSTPRESRNVTPDLSRSTEWRTVALSIFLLAAMNLINNRADMLMIGGMLGTTEVGFFSAANRYAQFLPFPLYAVNSLAAPMIASLYAEGRRAEIQRVVSLGALGIGCMAIPAAVFLIVAGRPLLRIYGVEFVQGYDALVWLTIGQLTTALGGSVTQLMTMTGHHRPAARIVGASAVLKLTLNVILIPRFGIAGAGMATAASIVLANLGMVIFVRRKLGFDPTLLGFIYRVRVR
jgi:O-antigen/teichoic acid export membrane protein